MKAGLANKAEVRPSFIWVHKAQLTTIQKLREASPQVSIADEGPGGAGRGRGRGGFARRELVAAGLGRQASGRGKPVDEES